MWCKGCWILGLVLKVNCFILWLVELHCFTSRLNPAPGVGWLLAFLCSCRPREQVCPPRGGAGGRRTFLLDASLDSLLSTSCAVVLLRDIGVSLQTGSFLLGCLVNIACYSSTGFTLLISECWEGEVRVLNQMMVGEAWLHLSAYGVPCTSLLYFSFAAEPACVWRLRQSSRCTGGMHFAAPTSFSAYSWWFLKSIFNGPLTALWGLPGAGPAEEAAGDAATAFGQLIILGPLMGNQYREF